MRYYYYVRYRKDKVVVDWWLSGTSEKGFFILSSTGDEDRDIYKWSRILRDLVRGRKRKGIFDPSGIRGSITQISSPLYRLEKELEKLGIRSEWTRNQVNRSRWVWKYISDIYIQN